MVDKPQGSPTTCTDHSTSVHAGDDLDAQIARRAETDPALPDRVEKYRRAHESARWRAWVALWDRLLVPEDEG